MTGNFGTDETLDSDGASADETAMTACSNCGTPIAVVTGIGPHEFVAAPCGCRVRPAVLGRGQTTTE